VCRRGRMERAAARSASCAGCAVVAFRRVPAGPRPSGGRPSTVWKVLKHVEHRHPRRRPAIRVKSLQRFPGESIARCAPRSCTGRRVSEGSTPSASAPALPHGGPTKPPNPTTPRSKEARRPTGAGPQGGIGDPPIPGRPLHQPIAHEACVAAVSCVIPYRRATTNSADAAVGVHIHKPTAATPHRCGIPRCS